MGVLQGRVHSQDFGGRGDNNLLQETTIGCMDRAQRKQEAKKNVLVMEEERTGRRGTLAVEVEHQERKRPLTHQPSSIVIAHHPRVHFHNILLPSRAAIRSEKDYS